DVLLPDQERVAGAVRDRADAGRAGPLSNPRAQGRLIHGGQVGPGSAVGLHGRQDRADAQRAVALQGTHVGPVTGGIIAQPTRPVTEAGKRAGYILIRTAVIDAEANFRSATGGAKV